MELENTISVHPNSGDLIPLLQSHLPRSGPLLRRLQHDLVRKSQTARYLATFPPTGLPTKTSGPPSPWLVAYVDLYAWPETQIWLYSNSEAESKTVRGEMSTLASSDSHINETRAQLMALISYCFEKLLPGFLSSLTESSAISGSHGNRPPKPPTTLVLGSVHSGLACLIKETVDLRTFLQCPKFHIPYIGHYFKYSFQQSAHDSTVNSSAVLPRRYRFRSRSGVEGYQPYQYDLIKSRCVIARSQETLERMASVVIYYDDPEITGTATDVSAEMSEQEMPIAWAFMGFDGSLVTLHVEPEHRRLGLGVLLGKSVMHQSMFDAKQFHLGMEHERERGWAFADVERKNEASQRTMEKMGGEFAWTVSWVLLQQCADE
ncbi:predicted protein [Uncinocarpus reesii 1704]|uniref:GCN5-related N-acetyltransferase Rv2170-like domain-containing protein n=1 Tax=Uncinocarpus reesii (strain UAMH 1704) TaxID=336963 RepID=C4JGE7_UNCRE|nr:uncharacterized protein UREG_01138 [Uncinocarpus reesii 1704]EEP76289.1 predicted protein [Uncinocarpus reesii 1704]